MVSLLFQLLDGLIPDGQSGFPEGTNTLGPCVALIVSLLNTEAQIRLVELSMPITGPRVGTPVFDGFFQSCLEMTESVHVQGLQHLRAMRG